MRFSPPPTIRTSSEFKTIYETGTRIENSIARLYFCQAPTLRIAYVASKRVGSSVERNAARRRAKEILRVLQHRLIRPIDLVVVLKSRMVEEPFRDLERKFFGVLRHNGLIQ